MRCKVFPISYGSSDFEKFLDWRRQYIGDNPANENDFDHFERLRDECSYIFAFSVEDEIVGGVRLTPVGHGITMGERLLGLDQYLPKLTSYLEVNRLVIEESSRGHLGLMKEALLSCFKWARDRTVYEGLIALCVPRMVPLYRRVGATLIASNINCNSIKDKSYSLINLNLKDIS